MTQIKLSLDDRRLITASKDGSLCFWEVMPPKSIEQSTSDKLDYANEILITKSELEEKNRLVFNLQQQVDETKTESEYQLRLKDNKFAEEMKMATKQFESEIAKMSQTVSRLQIEAKNESKKHDDELGELKIENEKAMVEMAEQYKGKLIVEYQKYDNLEEMYTSIKKNYDEKMKAVQKSTQNEVDEMKVKFDEKLAANGEEVKQYERDCEDKIKAVEEMLKQTEEDADKEILELKTKYEKTLRSERETNVRLRGEAGIVKKKLQAVLKDTDEHKSSIQRMSLENQKLHSSIRNLEKDIADLKNEIRSRDEAIAEKEKKTTELKRSAVVLDKNRFVLEHKIEELRQQILPKDDMIIDLRSQIDAMEDELNAVTRSQTELAIQLDDTKAKLITTSAELASERKKGSKQFHQFSRLQKDLGCLVNILQDAKALKIAVSNICKKYSHVIDPTIINSNLEDENESKKSLDEIMRQKAFLERSVSSLRNQMEKDKRNHRQEYLKKIKENKFLLDQIEDLKKEVKKANEYKVPSLRRHNVQYLPSSHLVAGDETDDFISRRTS